MAGLFDRTKGKIKQAIAGLTGNKGLKREGKRDETKGKVKGAVKDTRGAVKRAGHKVKAAAR